MKLLIITQKVDRNDPVLGFMHRWITEFAKRFESIIVICLEEGEHSLPQNVRVMSLGKEERQSRLQYLISFYWYVIHYRKEYDGVFIHMNQEYAILAGWLWKLLGKKATMWRNHYAGSFMTGIAAAFCYKVFYTSRYSYTSRYKNSMAMPVGVDTEYFKPDASVKRSPDSILSLGRIAPSKNLDILVGALGALRKDGEAFTASIYGDPSSPADRAYYESLKTRSKELEIGDSLSFHSAIPNDEAPKAFSGHEVFVNLSPSGMYDKTIFEAIACGCLVLVCNKDLKEKMGEDYFLDTEGADVEGRLAAKLSNLLSFSDGQRSSAVKAVQDKVLAENSLPLLADKLYTVFHD